MKTKRILSILMSVLMVIMMLPTNVFASDSPANVAGGTVTSSMTNFDALLGEGNYEYSDGTLKIVKDLRLGNGLTFDCNGRTLVLDLYGHTLDMVDISLTHKAGTLTITDSLGDGGIKTYGVPIVSNASGLTVSGGTFTSTGNNPALRSEMGNCTISGGTFNGRYALERTCEDYNSTYLKLSGSPVLNGSYDDICLWNPNPIYYDGYEPVPGNGPVSIYLKNFPASHYGRVVRNWDRSKNISDYFKYSGNETQNDPFLCVEKDYDFIIAEKPYDAWIGTTRLTRLNQGDVFGDGKVSITYTGPDSLYSLNLNNFSYEGKAHASGRGIIDIENYPYEDYKNRFQLLMNVTGTNSIVGINNTFSGISAGSNIGTFSLNGTGSLNISGCNYGIYMSNGNNWWFTRAANSDIPTLEITSTTAATNKDTYLQPNDDNYKVILGEESLRKESGNIATQNVKYLKIEQAPPLVTVSITTHPVGTTTLTEGSITGSLTAAGTVTNGSSETPDYQWYSNTINGYSGGTLISGATSPNFEIPKNLTAGTYYYYCTLSADNAETRYTSVAKVVVEAKVVIPTHTHNCGHDNCPDVWENFVVIDKNLGDTTNPRLANGNTYYYVLGDNMSSGGFNPSIGSGSTATVYLCLNGQSINDITIPVGVKMYVCDCTDEPGIISVRFNVKGTAMLGSGRYSLLRQMEDNAVVHVYGPITLSDYADFSSSGKSITLDNADAKIHFSAQPYAKIKFIPYGEGVFATGWASSYNSRYRPVSSDDAYEVSYNSTTFELSFVRKATAQAPAIDTNVSVGEASYDKGGNAQTLNVAASVADGGTLTYQWYKSETNSTTNGTAISGATGASYTPSTSVVGTAYYYCVVTNTNNGATTSVATNVAKVTINEPIVLHTHCICGEIHNNVGDHTEEDVQNFTAVSTYDELVAAATNGGNYYLANDIEINSTITVTGDLTLCLNGHSLSPADGFSNNIFDLNGTLTLTDCVGGGKITGSKSYSVYLRGGTFNMYGGAITESNDSAVQIEHNGTFNMYGGEIKNNKAYRGAGIYHHDGSIRISGGTITGNVAKDEGGAIFSQQSGIEICGNPVIAENFVNSGADGEANQINNFYAYPIDIVGPMTDGASIGMTIPREEFGYFAIETYDSSADYSKYFFSDKGYPVYKEGDFYYFGYRITKQPSDTDYSVEVNSTNGASYQWCEVIKGAPISVDDTYLEDNDGYVIGDYDENGWSAFVNSSVSMYFGIEMNANDELTAKFASAPQGEVVLINADTDSSVPVVSGGENTYTFITVDEGPYLLAVFAEDGPTVKATLTKNTLREVDGKTAATLDTGNLPTGNYACQVTWDMGTPDDTSDDYILQSALVNYVLLHTHCICGEIHNNVGDHTEEVVQNFTAVSTYAELVAAATNGGNYYLANDIEITSAVTVEADDTFTLCLNGKKLYYGGTERVSIFALYGTLNITDCGTNVREGHVDDSSLMWKEGEGDESEDLPYNLTGGLITGSTGSSNTVTSNGQNFVAHGGALYMTENSEFNFYGGNFAGNKSQNDGAVIIGKHCDINIYGGTMVGNWRGAIYCYDTAGDGKTLAIHGGIIEYNHSGYSYSEVEFDGNFTMTGGQINAKLNNGSAVSVSVGNVIISGGTITNNYGNALEFSADYDYFETEEENTYISDYVLKTSVNISGGTLQGTDEAIRLHSGNIYLSGTPNISGGTCDIVTFPEAPYEEIYEGVKYVVNIVSGRIIVAETLNLNEPICIKPSDENEYSIVTTDFTLNWTENMGDADASKYFVAHRPRYGIVKNAETGELIVETRAITQEPALENDYTVKVNAYGEEYQWLNAKEQESFVTDETAIPLSNNYDSATGKWSAVDMSYFCVELAQGDRLMVEFSSNDECNPALFSFATYDYIFGTKNDSGYVFTAPTNGRYLLMIGVLNNGGAEPISLMSDPSETEYPSVVAKKASRVYTELDGQTAPTLNTSELGGGKYVCRVTWNMGTLSDESDDYSLISDTVNLPYVASVGTGGSFVSGVEAEGLDNVAVTYETDITLEVKVETATDGDAEQEAIKNISGAPTAFAFYDIVIKALSGAIIPDTNENVIEIKLPYDFSRKTNIKVYRYHNDSPKELAQLDVRATAPYVDGKCFVDEENGCIYIYSSKFSTYAVAYDTVGSSSDVGVTRYTVKFDTDGGSKIASKTVTRNSKIAKPTAPEKEGYTFIGWFIDEEFTTAYDFESKITKNITLYAKWEKHEDEKNEDEGTHNCPSLSFTDLDVNAWYHEAVDYALENGIFKGIGETTFAPNEKLTRAMLVTVLYRMENEPATNCSIPFSDIDMGAYYANAVSWAKQNGIVNGVTENKFAPDESITREQIVAIMMRYAVYKGMDAVTLEENLHFSDADEISEYAVSSMNWAVGTGLINGKSKSTLAPKDNATRIEVAAILHRFMEENK